MNQTCPSETALREFNDGRIDDLEVIDQITDHLGDCDACIDRLELMSPGPIAEGLRKSASAQLIAGDTGSFEEELDLQSMRGNVDQIISNVDSLLADKPVDSLEFAEDRFHVIGSIREDDFGCEFGALVEEVEANTTTAVPVAIKIPHGHKLTSNQHRRQFFEDCRKAQGLEHAGIRSVLEFGHWDERRLFLSMPLIQQPTLTKFAKGTTSLQQSTWLSIFNQLVDAVHYAHRQNVIHRHLNPGNIHVILPDASPAPDSAPPKPEFRVIISDFGFVLDSRYHFDLIEPISTNSPFDAPEATTLNAEFVDERTDIYALGKILKLFMRLSVDAHESDRVQKIIDKSTFLRRRDRYQTINELKSALELI